MAAMSPAMTDGPDNTGGLMRPPTAITHCRRCGTCCRQGGPALHLEDRELVESGKLPLQDLFTIRRGEPAYDNVTGVVAPAVTDIIKVNSASPGSDTCRFYESATKGCAIYGDRPAECRALQCWDTQRIEALYHCRRLERRHLLVKASGIWELVQEHQGRCDYELVAELAAGVKQNSSSADVSHDKLLELVRYDESLRQVTIERAGLNRELLPFLYGRPLSFTIQMFKLKLARSSGVTRLVPVGAAHERVCYRRQ
jgi:Fe-S-cluster containining protein